MTLITEKAEREREREREERPGAAACRDTYTVGTLRNDYINPLSVVSSTWTSFQFGRMHMKSVRVPAYLCQIHAHVNAQFPRWSVIKRRGGDANVL